MESSRKTPWKIYKACKTGFAKMQIPPSLTLQDGTETTSVKETADTLLHKFFTDDPTVRNQGSKNTKREETKDLGPPDSLPEPDFTEHEVDEAVRNLHGSKCPGPDGIDGNIVKKLHKYLPRFWLDLFNRCYALGCFPTVWKVARVISIPKADKSKHRSVEGFRGISLLSIPGKCLEKLVIGRLNHFLVTNGHIASLQFGFPAGRTTADTIETVIKFVENSRKRGQKCCLLALDIAGAFDNAWHPGILEQLRKIKCPPNMYNMVKDFLCKCTAHVMVGNTISSKRVTKGCPQGSVSGPTLWNIVIGDLITLLSNVTNVKTVVFADDIMIILQGPSLPAILKELQITLKAVDNWCKENGLVIAKDKTGLMLMITRNKEAIKSHPIVTERKIKIVTQMKYLGVTLDSKLDWYPHTVYLENKVLSILRNLVHCSTATWGLSFHNLLIIYNCAILPVITYTSEAWCTLISKKAKRQATTNTKGILNFYHKGIQNSIKRGTVSNCRDSSHRASHATTQRQKGYI